MITAMLQKYAMASRAYSVLDAFGAHTVNEHILNCNMPSSPVTEASVTALSLRLASSHIRVVINIAMSELPLRRDKWVGYIPAV